MPGNQLVTEKFQVDWGHYLSSHKNYIYAEIDGRGSGYQGDKRLKQVFKKLGKVEVEDQLDVIRYLSSYSCIIFAINFKTLYKCFFVIHISETINQY